MTFYQKLNQRFIKFLMSGAIVLAIAAGFLQTAQAQPAPVKTDSPAAKKPLPNLTLPTLDGKSWSLNKQRGRVVVMNFWATWCLPCHEEIPVLVNLSGKYKKDGLGIVGVAVNSYQPGEIKKFVAKFKVSYPVLLPNPDSLLAQQDALPMTLLIDEKGVLVEKIIGASDEEYLETEIKKLLAKLPAAKTKKAPAAKR